MDTKFHKKIKENIIHDLNQDLYKYLNLSLYETNHYFGYYNGYIYNLIDKVYERHGPSGLRSEVKYIVQYLTFLFNKLDSNSIFQDYILVTFYFRMYYRHYSQRKAIQINQLSFSF